MPRPLPSRFFQFVSQPSSYHSTLHTVRYWQKDYCFRQRCQQYSAHQLSYSATEANQPRMTWAQAIGCLVGLSQQSVESNTHFWGEKSVEHSMPWPTILFPKWWFWIDAPFIGDTIYLYKFEIILTCRPIAMERVDKHASMEMDSWKPTRYGTRFRAYEWSTNISLDTDMLYKRPFRSEWNHPVWRRGRIPPP
jgi:hypothetical protein